MEKKYLLVERKFDKAKCVAQYKVDENGNFVRSEGVYLARTIDEAT